MKRRLKNKNADRVTPGQVLGNLRALVQRPGQHGGSKTQRHRPHITLVGEQGRKWRIALAAAAAGLVLLAVVLAVALQNGPQIMASPEIVTIQDEGILRVGLLEGMPGLAENGQGFEAELALMLAERILPDALHGNAVKYVAVTSKTVIPRLSDSTINVAAALCETGASQQYIYSEPYLVDTCRFAILEGTRVEAKDIAVGVIQNSSQQKLLEEYTAARPTANIETVLFAGYDDMLTALEKRRISAAVMTDIFLQKYAAEYPITGTSLELGNVEYSFICPSDSPAIAEVANLMLAELKESGELEAMWLEHGLPAATHPYG